jgi:hypothetical protein
VFFQKSKLLFPSKVNSEQIGGCFSFKREVFSVRRHFEQNMGRAREMNRKQVTVLRQDQIFMTKVANE